MGAQARQSVIGALRANLQDPSSASMKQASLKADPHHQIPHSPSCSLPAQPS